MEAIGILEERAVTYGLLSRLYLREVDEELLEGMRQLSWGDEATAVSSEAGADSEVAANDSAGSAAEAVVGGGQRLMGAYLEACGDDVLTELAVDFARLFVVREAHATDAPYPSESVYGSAERTAMGGARDAVRALYRSEGLGPGAAENLPDDHLALELAFMQALCARETEALRAGDENEARRLADVQRQFLGEHLLGWTTPFARAMEKTARTGFYRGLARYTRAFLIEDGLALGAAPRLAEEAAALCYHYASGTWREERA